MKCWGNLSGMTVRLALAIFALAMLSACADDLYAPCNLDPDSPDEAVRECASEGGDEDRTCAVKNQVQCESRVCARFAGSDPFCTVQCTSDGECPSGRCEEIPFALGEKFCVENVNLD